MMYFIHFDPADGAILGWGNSFEPVPIEGMSVAVYPLPIDIDPATQKIDPDSGAVVRKSLAERRAMLLPTPRDIEVALFMEFLRTDRMVLPDAPLDDAGRQAWLDYRQTLYRLGGMRDVAVIIAAWERAPDGLDPIAHLRERLAP